MTDHLYRDCLRTADVWGFGTSLKLFKDDSFHYCINHQSWNDLTIGEVD